jgi:hypothetical protein
MLPKTEDIYMDLESLWQEFAENHDKSFNNKAAARRARKALGDLKKLVTSYRKASVEEDK